MQALFLRHEGYLGAIGAFLKGAEQDSEYRRGGRAVVGSRAAGQDGLGTPRPGRPQQCVFLVFREMSDFTCFPPHFPSFSRSEANSPAGLLLFQIQTSTAGARTMRAAPG